mmetsp:Transcript_5682/g.13638  ORF Transcript_5682/g.13638 Transcript_5682/m.13638 type:complete len:272 (-) Transcript_5682:278-1093(-)
MESSTIFKMSLRPLPSQVMTAKNPPPPAPHKEPPTIAFCSIKMLSTSATTRGSTPLSKPAMTFFSCQYLERHSPTLSMSAACAASAASLAPATSSSSVFVISSVRRPHLRRTFTRISFANLGCPEKARTILLSKASRVSSSRGTRLMEVRRGMDWADFPTLSPPTSPLTWSCHPPPVVINCSSVRTAPTMFSSAFGDPIPVTFAPTHFSIAARTQPPRMLLVPRPDPLGRRDVEMTSRPTLYVPLWQNLLMYGCKSLSFSGVTSTKGTRPR